MRDRLERLEQYYIKRTDKKVAAGFWWGLVLGLFIGFCYYRWWM